MNREDIIRMAREAGLWPAVTDTFPKELQVFAALVASAEREACAKRLDAVGCDHCAENIRRRGEE